MAQGLLAVEGTHQTFVLTEDSRPVLRNERVVKLRRDPAATVRVRARSARAPQVALAPDAAPLFERLRAWRGTTAKEQGVPAYVIFHDATLREIATQEPRDLAALAEISGVGETKLAKYGPGVLAAVAG
jgi:ATP-dependent DNA helicase RecQ